MNVEIVDKMVEILHPYKGGFARELRSIPVVKTKIKTAADFPTPREAESTEGTAYAIGECPVTDNEPTKTNTGMSFYGNQHIVWDISWGGWIILAVEELKKPKRGLL